MLNKYCLTILLGLMFFSCAEQGEKPNVIEEKEIRVNVPSYAFQSNLNVWLILNNSQGEVVTYQKVSNGQSYILKIPEMDRASITLLSVNNTNQFQNFNIQSYQMIRLEDEFTLGLRPAGYSSPQKGVPIQIQVKFPEEGGWAMLSHKTGDVSDKLFTQQYLNGTIVSLKVSPVVGEPDYLLVAESSQGEKRSTIISLDESSNGLEINFNDLTPISENLNDLSDVLDSNFELRDYSIYEAIPVNDSWFRNGYLKDSQNLNPYRQGGEQNVIVDFGDALHRFEFYYQNPDLPRIHLFYSGIDNSLETPLPTKDDFQVQNKRFDSFQFSKLPNSSDWKISFERPSTSNQPPYQSIKASVFGNGMVFNLTFPDELLTQYPFLEELNSIEASYMDQYFRSETYDELMHNRLVEFSDIKTGFVLEVKKGL